MPREDKKDDWACNDNCYAAPIPERYATLLQQKQTVPPMPDHLKKLLELPSPPELEALDRQPIAGTVWEVSMPDKGIEVFLIVEGAEIQVPLDDESPFSVCRVCPLNELVGLVNLEDDAFVEVHYSTGPELSGAFLHLEGPIGTSALLRCIGEISPDGIAVVENKRGWLRHVAQRMRKSPGRLNQAVYLFRAELRKTIDPVYRDSWRLLYEALDKFG